MNGGVPHRFAFGAGTAIVSSYGAALVASERADPIIDRLRDHLIDGETFGELVESLLRAGVNSLPPFAVISSLEGGYRLLVRGDVRVDVTTNERIECLSGENLTVWREESYSEIGFIELRMAECTSLPFEVDSGVVPAAAVRWTPVGAQSMSPASRPPAVHAEPTQQPDTPDAPVASAERTEIPRTPVSVEEQQQPAEPVNSAGLASAAPPNEPEPEPPEASEVVESPGPTIDDIDHTVVRMEPPEPDADAPPAQSPPGLISGKPPELGSSVAAAALDTDHDGRTEIRRPTSSATAAMPTIIDSGPTVHAVTCPSGHPNPVTQGRCRQCDTEIVDRASVTIPRPLAGVLRFSNNDVVELDGPIVIGRMPPGDPIDGTPPRIVAIDDSELSRFHALVTIDGWFVYVADQGSTNETSVIAPGRPPMTCRAHERVLLPPGAVVNLGGAVTCRFDVT